MRYFPIFMDLQRQNVLVVGGGTVAERKIRLLLESGAIVHVAALTLSENIAGWLRHQKIRFAGDKFTDSLLAGKRLVFAATNDRVLNRKVFMDAERLGIPVNVVDDVEFCRFISPAVVDRTPVQVAISTAGTAPVLARLIRGWIEWLLPQGLGRVAAAAGRIRIEAKRVLPASKRRKFWEHLLTRRKLNEWSSHSSQQIEFEMRSSLNGKQTETGKGMVYLVGAGPGRPDQLTLKALEVLNRADVILYDRLVSEEVLNLARRDADRINVGKRAGHHHRTQQEIHQIMLAEAAKGRIVARLKGGDSFIFGRGGEELEVLRAHGVEYEVVPGITAAVGCAAFAGIPLTHRDHAQALTFVTGHRSDGASRYKINWNSVAGPGKTVVVYMGLGQAENIRRELLTAGVSQYLPVALIADGTRDQQQTIHGTVSQLPAMAHQVKSGVPGLLIIGQVAALGSDLGWFNPKLFLPVAA